MNPGGWKERPFVSYQKTIVSVSLGCHNKLPQLSGLKQQQQQKCSLPVLEAGSSKSRCQQGCVPCEGSGGGEEHSLFLPGSDGSRNSLMAPAMTWLIDAELQSLFLLSYNLLFCVFLHFYLLEGQLSWDLR